MRPHNDRWEKLEQDFDRDFERIRKLNLIVFAVSAILGLGLIGFFVWVVVKLLRFVGAV